MNVNFTSFSSAKGIWMLFILVILLFSACHNKPRTNAQEPDTQGQEWEKTHDPNTMKIEGGRLWSYLLAQKSTMGKINRLDKAKFYPNTWRPVDDFFANLAVQKIAYDPTDKNIYYFCTGEGWGNKDGVKGAGVWKSDNKGETWYQLSTTMGPEFDYCLDMLVHPVTGDVYVATKSNGVMRSIDKGGTWQQVLGIGKGSVLNSSCDIEITKDNELIVSIGVFESDGIYYSTSGEPGSWEKRSTGIPTASHRIELATAPSNANVMYAIPISAEDFIITGVYRSDNKGLSWNKMSYPGGDAGLAHIQGWYNLIIKVDPNNDQVAIAGGTNCYRTMDGGDSWQLLFDGYKLDKGVQYVHPDQHEIVFMNSDTVFLGNDGGIYRCDNMTADVPYFYPINDNYNVTQFYSCAQAGQVGSHRIIGGTQDNGSIGSLGTGISEFEKLTGSDGGFSEINSNHQEVWFTTSQYSTIYRSRNSVIENITNKNIGQTLFINPLHLDPNNPEILYQSSLSSGIWRLNNASIASGDNWERAGSSNNATITAFGISKNPANIIFFGSAGNTGIWRIEGVDKSVHSSIPINCDPNKTIPKAKHYCSSIAVDPSDGNHVVVTYSNYGVESIWECKNALSSNPEWKSQEGDMPDVPVRWAVIHPNNPEVCYLATEVGVMMTRKLDGIKTRWVLVTEAIANVRTDMLRIRENDTTMLVATHGRGLFTGKIKSDYSVEWQERGPMNVGGRTRSIMIDPNDPLQKKLWAGSVSGGLWVANDYDSITVFTETETETEDGDYKIIVGPNPTIDKRLKVIVTTYISRKMDIDIYDINGKLVEQESYNLEPGDHWLEVDLARLRSAIYFMRVNNGEEKKVYKILVP